MTIDATLSAFNLIASPGVPTRLAMTFTDGGTPWTPDAAAIWIGGSAHDLDDPADAVVVAISLDGGEGGVVIPGQPPSGRTPPLLRLVVDGDVLAFGSLKVLRCPGGGVESTATVRYGDIAVVIELER